MRQPLQDVSGDAGLLTGTGTRSEGQRAVTPCRHSARAGRPMRRSAGEAAVTSRPSLGAVTSLAPFPLLFLRNSAVSCSTNCHYGRYVAVKDHLSRIRFYDSTYGKRPG